MTQRPFHHGNLRATLLYAAEKTLRAEGVEALSLRQLAREAGVSHAAPRRHFADRQALLNALAEQGFRRLADAVLKAGAEGAGGYEERFQALARAYVEFALHDAALMDLMFATKSSAASPGVTEAAESFFTAVTELIGQGAREGRLTLDDPERLQMLLVSTLHGIATLVATGRFPAGEIDRLIADATTLFLRRP
ncbi:TetR/AcrR family transcriptional regulator [Dactylosporangium sp. CA-092794]|uniref:TetR/AcrR family transcriptional regulator n=1 Tax=Dactylosporangium sp. CA-092794 TaxID=3239929 RepID=UPI003D8A738D